MNQYVTDTMAIVLYLSKRKLPLSVKQLFQSADLGLTSITVPALVAVEISYLSSKGRIDVSLAGEGFGFVQAHGQQHMRGVN